MLTRRFRTGTPSYPLAIANDILWRREGDDLLARFELPPLEEGVLIVPSLSATGKEYEWSATWHFRNGDRRWRLDTIPVPVSGSSAPDTDPEALMQTRPYVETQVDCFFTKAPIEVSFLELRLHGGSCPEESLIVIAARPYQLTAPDVGVRVAPPQAVAAISQMQASPSIRRHVCSPTCLSMVMGLSPEQAYQFAEQCYDPVRKMFGIWPRNIRAANAHGFSGAIETFSSLDEAAELIARGYPIIASIRYGKGELSGGAVDSTGGHLVVLRGLSEDKVLVNDPAADTHDQVAREYDRKEFAQAWLGARGVGYVLAARQ